MCRRRNWPGQDKTREVAKARKRAWGSPTPPPPPHPEFLAYCEAKKDENWCPVCPSCRPRRRMEHPSRWIWMCLCGRHLDLTRWVGTPTPGR